MTVAHLRRDPYEMGPREFEKIRQMVYDFCGVDLRGKQVLVGSRLGKQVRQLGLDSFETYCDRVMQNPKGELFTSMIDALTTNHTSFFREEQHFRYLREVILPGLPPLEAIKIWSAACSTGEEPYTIAFSLIEGLAEPVLSRASILATDISTRVLDIARQGLYPANRVVSLPKKLLTDCWLRGTGKYADSCLVKPAIRKIIQFRQFNLLDDCSEFGTFHVIFCRNVMIYFDLQTQQAVVNRLASRLIAGGHLFIGHSESLNGIEHNLAYVAPAIYRKGTAGSRGVRRQSASRLWGRSQ